VSAVFTARLRSEGVVLGQQLGDVCLPARVA